MKSVLSMERYDENDLVYRKRQIIGGSCNYKMIYGFIFTDENNANSFILSITDDDYYKNSKDNSVRVSTDKQYINPDFNEFKYIVMELLGGNNSNEVFSAFYFGLMTQTVNMHIEFKASKAMIKYILSSHVDKKVDYELINEVILNDLMSDDKDEMLNDIYNSIQAILHHYKYIPQKDSDSLF